MNTPATNWYTTLDFKITFYWHSNFPFLLNAAWLSFLLVKNIQLWNSDYKRLLNEPYVDEVTLTMQNLPLKCYQPLELFTQLKKGFRSLNAENFKPVGQRAVKLWEWFDVGLARTQAECPCTHFNCGMAEAADFFLRPPTLTASNFASLWPKDPILNVLKDLNPSLKRINIFRGLQDF